MFNLVLGSNGKEKVIPLPIPYPLQIAIETLIPHPNLLPLFLEKGAECKFLDR